MARRFRTDVVVKYVTAQHLLKQLTTELTTAYSSKLSNRRAAMSAGVDRTAFVADRVPITPLSSWLMRAARLVDDGCTTAGWGLILYENLSDSLTL